MEKKYSVLMCVYKAEKPENLKMAIDSMLNQSIPPTQFVIIKDGELTEGLEAVLDLYAQNPIFTILENPPKTGLGNALAFGIQNCENEWIARMDSDDFATPERIEKQLKIFETHPEIDAVGSIAAEFEEDIQQIVDYHWLPETNEEIVRFAKKRNPLVHSSMILKKSKVLACGNYQENLYFEDYDLWIRMLQAGCQFYNCQEPLVFMRISKDFYKRRGGFFYFKQMHQFKRKQYKNGFYSWQDYVISLGAHGIVCLLPNGFRKWFYLKFLRKQKWG